MRVRNLMFLLLGIQAHVRARSNQDIPSLPQRKQIRFKLWKLFVRSVTSHISFRLSYHSRRSILIPLQGLNMYLRFLKTKTFPFTHTSFPSSTFHTSHSNLYQHHHLIRPFSNAKVFTLSLKSLSSHEITNSDTSKSSSSPSSYST